MIRKLLFVLIAFFLILPFVSATVVYNESFSFNGGGTDTDAVADSGGFAGFGGADIGAINAFVVNFNNIKIIGNVTAPNTCAAAAACTILLNAGANGINTQYVSFTSTVGGTFLGSGLIGWERTSGNSFNYKIIYTVYDNTYAQSLVGEKTVVLTYDATVYTSYLNANFGNIGTHQPPVYTYDYILVNVIDNAGSRNPPIVGTYQTQFTFNNQYILTANQIDNFTAWINLTKNNNNARFNITNSTGDSFYDVTSTSNVAKFLLKNGGIKTKLQDQSNGDWANRTIFDAGGNVQATPTPPTPGIGGSQSGQIYYDYSNATLNSAYGINVSIANANYSFLDTYFIAAFVPGGTIPISGFPIRFSTQTYNTSRLWSFNSGIGTYNATLYRCSIFNIFCSSQQVVLTGLDVIDTASLFISQQQYAYNVSSEASSYSGGDTIHFVVSNPSPSTTYFNVFSEVGGQNPIIDLPIFPNTVRYVNLSVSGDMLFGNWEGALYTGTNAAGKVANKVFTIGNPTPGTRVSIRWDINNLIGQTNNLYFTTNQNTSTVRVYKPIVGTNQSGLTDTFTANPADSQKPYLMDTVGNWNATITDDGNASNTSSANITVLASLTQLGCNNKLPNYVCWNNATYFAGDAFVLNYKDSAIAGIQIQTANLVIYDPNGAMKYSTNLCSAVFSCVSAISGSVPGAFATNAIPGKYHAAIVHGGTNASSFTDGTIIADSYAVVATQPSPTPPPSQTSGTQIIDTLIFLATNPIIWTIIVTLLAMGLVGQLTKPNASLPVVVTAFASLSIAAFFGAFPIWIPVGMILVAIALIAANIAKVFDVGANK